MSRVSFAALVGFLLAVLLPLGTSGQDKSRQDKSAQEKSRPNILFLIADDFCYEALGYLGHTDIETPNLDRLARRGTTFTHAYNMGSFSGAVCVASRAMVISGRSVWRAQDIFKTMDREREAGRLWPQLLKTAGYDTYMTGKWHIQAKAEAAFDITRHIRAGMPPTVEASYNRPQPGKPDPWSPTDKSLGGFWEGGKHWSEVGADDAIDYLDRAKQRSNPFFGYIAFNAPHDPRQSPQEYLDRYPLERIQVPENFQPLYPYKDDIGCHPTQRDESLGPFPRTEHAVKVHRREYYSLITHLDAQLGRIFDKLESLGLADNTWVFFTADHGLAVGHHGLFGKQNLHDASVRVPFIVTGPGVKRGERIAAPIYMQDVMPTALELAGVAKPPQVEFHSLLPLLRGEQTASNYPAIYGGYLLLQRSVTADGWKLILYPKAKVARLYHIAADPQELHDVAGDAANGERKKQLFAQLLKLQTQFADTLDLRETFAELAN
jgi:choline-sulfatase